MDKYYKKLVKECISHEYKKDITVRSIMPLDRNIFVVYNEGNDFYTFTLDDIEQFKLAKRNKLINNILNE